MLVFLRVQLPWRLRMHQTQSVTAGTMSVYKVGMDMNKDQKKNDMKHVKKSEEKKEAKDLRPRILSGFVRIDKQNYMSFLGGLQAYRHAIASPSTNPGFNGNVYALPGGHALAALLAGHSGEKVAHFLRKQLRAGRRNKKQQRRQRRALEKKLKDEPKPQTSKSPEPVQNPEIVIPEVAAAEIAPPDEPDDANVEIVVHEVEVVEHFAIVRHLTPAEKEFLDDWCEPLPELIYLEPPRE